MWVTALLTILAAVCMALLAGKLAQVIFQCITRKPWQGRRDLSGGVVLRSFILGSVAGGGGVGMLALRGDSGVTTEAVFWIVAASFCLTMLETFSWLRLVTLVHPQAVEAGEISLLTTAVLLAGLYLIGILWVTLIAVGLLTLCSLAVAGGLYLYGLI